MSAVRPWGQAKLASGPAAAIVVLGDLLVCAVLLLMSIGIIGAEPTTRAEETAAWQSAGKLYFGWLVVGAASFAVLRMPKALLAHVSTMLLSPVALFVLLLSSSPG
ncbi:hypothetical protein JGS22_017755 [Streptomyces sp. P38-E01]|uniref:Uncharacterized protein n=1 Tax=Streptomyces tardus TaxID=2780544 RepID=A0A949JG35_9ACTN|nr:hypothetical protein [Streptomyces tardus]MBU7599411.1 hypothetical protein [Streptomyces tardus]